MKNSYILLFTLLLFVFVLPLNAQEHKEHEHEHEEFNHHKIGLFIGFTFVPSEVSVGNDRTLIVPTVGVDYFYMFNHKYAVGLMTDIELATYAVETEENRKLSRDYALVTALVFNYEPVSWWSVFAGPGYEFEHNESFFLARLGTEFLKHFEDAWSLALTMTVDIKEVNTAPAIGLTVFKGL